MSRSVSWGRLMEKAPGPYKPIERHPKKIRRSSEPIPVDLDSDFRMFPDDIIACILSKLSLKEAVRTSVVSRRWETLWRHRFDTGSIVLSVECNPIRNIISQKNFVEWVDDLLKPYKNRPIREFVLRYVFTTSFSATVVPWLEFALRNNVERICLDAVFQAEPFCCEFPDLRKLLTSPPLFSSVEDVSFCEFRIQQSVFDDLLSRLPNLKRLSLRKISGIRNLNIAGETIKCLEVKNCSSLEQLVVSAPNIVSLNYGGDGRKLHLGNLPLLSEFFISETRPHFFRLRNKFPKNVASQLTTLKFVATLLTVSSDERMCYNGICTYPPVSIAFPVLKRLEIVMDVLEHHPILWPISLIRNAPKLHKFKHEMKAWLQEDVVTSEDTTNLQLQRCDFVKKPAEWIWDGKLAKSGEHKSLKVVELHGFAGFSNQWELFKQILEIAENLAETVLYMDPSYHSTDRNYVSKARTVAERLVAPPTKLVVRNSVMKAPEFKPKHVL